MTKLYGISFNDESIVNKWLNNLKLVLPYIITIKKAKRQGYTLSALNKLNNIDIFRL